MDTKRRLKAGYDTDKWPELFEEYDGVFRPLADAPITLLELGVARGGSLELWRDYFPAGRIVGLDRYPSAAMERTERIRVYTGAQDDTGLLDDIASREAPTGFDIIIDDASHIGSVSRVSFWHLFCQHLRPGGLYCIEDWGTGFWSSWPDGTAYAWHADSPVRDGWRPRAEHDIGAREFPSHQHGMVGMLKEIVDEVGRADITKGHPTALPSAAPRIKEVRILPGLAIVTKARAVTSL